MSVVRQLAQVICNLHVNMRRLSPERSFVEDLIVVHKSNVNLLLLTPSEYSAHVWTIPFTIPQREIGRTEVSKEMIAEHLKLNVLDVGVHCDKGSA